MRNHKKILIAGMSMMLLFIWSGLLSAAQDAPLMEPPGNGPGMERGFGPGHGPGMGQGFGPGHRRDRGPGDKPGFGPMQQLHRLGPELQLNEDQKEGIREIMDANKDAAEEARQKIEQAESELDANSPETFNALGTAHAEAAYQRAQIFEEIKALLTNDQLDKLEKIKQSREERPDGIPGPRRGRVDF